MIPRPPSRTAAAVLTMACLSCSPASDRARGSSGHPAREGGYPAEDVRRLTARTLRTYQVPEAAQAVAADAQHFYAVGNSVLAKYDIDTARRLDEWDGRADGLLRHLNSCLVLTDRLWCANSNYPDTPMGSSVEVFDTSTLDHVESRSLGMTEEGSLTWFDRYADGWIAGFAHYDGSGGLALRDHTFSNAVALDSAWRRTGGWLYPTSVLDRMAPYAASGGAIGPDGWLYLHGHDRPELYVVARPAMGPVLIHLATINLETEGQGFSWAQDGTRTIYTIDRRKRLVRAIAVPPVETVPSGLIRTFR